MDKQHTKAADYLVINSLTNLNKAQAILKQYKTISLFLHHDSAGRKAEEKDRVSCLAVSLQDVFSDSANHVSSYHKTSCLSEIG